MLFKDLKQNYPVFILDKQNLTFIQGKAQSVSFPRIENSIPVGMNKTVVDVVIDASGKSATYAIPENNSVVYTGDLVLSTDKEGILKEVEAMRTSAEQILSSVERQKEIINKTTSLLTELNPEYKAKQENEKRLSNLESSMQELKEMMSGFIKELKG